MLTNLLPQLLQVGAPAWGTPHGTWQQVGWAGEVSLCQEGLPVNWTALRGEKLKGKRYDSQSQPPRAGLPPALET